MVNKNIITKFIEFSDLEHLDKNQEVYVSRITILNKIALMQLQGETDTYKINIMRKTIDKLYSKDDELSRPVAYIEMSVNDIKHVFSYKDILGKNKLYIYTSSPNQESSNDESEAE